MLTIDSAAVQNLTFDTVRKFLLRHEKEFGRLDKLQRYYLGKHDVLNRKKESGVPNNKIVCNHAKEISDTATGYFIGNPITYTGKQLGKLTEWFGMCAIDNVDMSVAKDMSKFGRGYELICMSDDEVSVPKSYCIHPKDIFVVYDDTVVHNPLFAVYYYPVLDADENHLGYKVWVYTKNICMLFNTDTVFKQEILSEEHDIFFGDVPIIEYSNNEEQQGDFEQVIGLLDAYNLLMSDRVNDKEQFVDAILLLINAMLGDDDEERNESIELLKQKKMLELPAESDARYLTRTFDESGVEILKKALEQDIHKFANVPCMSDENFVGNASGVAMEYKLLGLEMLTKIKESNFKKGLKRRIKMYGAIAKIKGCGTIGEAEPVFTRGLPKNITELSDIVSQLSGIVPDKILLSILPFVKDAEEAIKLLKEQKAENAKEAQQQFGTVNNSAFTGEVDEE